MTWAAVAVGAATVIGGAMSADAAKSAAGAQGQAAADAISGQQQAAGWSNDRLQPFLTGGTEANSRLLNLLGLQDPTGEGGSLYRMQASELQTPQFKALTDPIYRQYGVSGPGQNHDADVAATSAWSAAQPQQSASNTPGFGSLTAPFTQTDLNNDVPYNTSLQFGLDEGEKAVNRNAASHGSLDSGATDKAIARYATDYGGTKATDAYNRSMAQKSQIYGMLSGQSAQGANVAGNMGSISMGNAANIGNLTTQQGNAASAGIIGSSNALSGAVSGGVNAYNQGNILNALTGGGARGGTSAGNPPMNDMSGYEGAGTF